MMRAQPPLVYTYAHLVFALYYTDPHTNIRLRGKPGNRVHKYYYADTQLYDARLYPRITRYTASYM